jgi:Patatin-like phospholipase
MTRVIPGSLPVPRSWSRPIHRGPGAQANTAADVIAKTLVEHGRVRYFQSRERDQRRKEGPPEMIFIAAMLSISVILTGCFAKIHELPSQPETAEPLFAPLPDQDFMVGLAVSGGGSRAATFAAAALEALAELPVHIGTEQRSVLETVSYMSSVSGGSLATAYYVTKKPPRSEPILGADGMTPRYREFFSAYKTVMQSDFQQRAVLRQLAFFRALNPTKLAYSLSEVWDNEFLGDITFAQLYEREQRGDIPRVILNGTVYNSGQRFAFTTLPASDFDYDFIELLTNELKKPNRPVPVTAEGMAIIEAGLKKASRQFLPLSFERIGADYRNLPLSLAVATSASFPPVVGPVTYQVAGRPTYLHIGDGGLFDNLGTESLTTLFLKKIPQGSSKSGLIIVIDTSFPFDAGGPQLDKSEKGFEVFRDDPSRIVGIMEERANTYQTLLWHSLRTEGVVLPDFAHLRIEVLKHVDAEWTGYDDLPEACRGDFLSTVTPAQIKQAVSEIPTLFKIKTPCHGALLQKAARKVVAQHRPRIVSFIEAHLRNPKP